MRGGHPKEMRQNEVRKEDHRGMNNMRIVNRGIRNDENRMESNNIRKDDYYGR